MHSLYTKDAASSPSNSLTFGQYLGSLFHEQSILSVVGGDEDKQQLSLIVPKVSKKLCKCRNKKLFHCTLPHQIVQVDEVDRVDRTLAKSIDYSSKLNESIAETPKSIVTGDSIHYRVYHKVARWCKTVHGGPELVTAPRLRSG